MRKALRVALAALTAISLLTPAPALALQTWQQLPMPTGLAPDNVRDIGIAPNGDVVVDFDTQGIWRSSDHGQTWQSLEYNLPATATIGFLAFNKQGDLLYAPSDTTSRGVYRLPVGSTTWTPAAINWAGWNGSHVPARMVMNAAGDIICSSSSQDIMRSTDGGASFSMVTDLNNPLAGAALFDLITNPLNANEIAIGNETGPLHLSTDGGLTWTDIGKPGGNARLVYSPTGQLFSSATHDAAAKGWLLARRTGGANWVQSDTGLPAYQDTRASATSVSQMFVGNNDVYISKDNGSTWSVAGAGFPNLGGTQHLRDIAVGDDGYLYAGVSQGATTKGLWRMLAYLPGDANQDGKVTFADYIILANNFGQAGEWISGDFSGDDNITFADYIQLANNFGQSVPEPATLAMLAMGGLGLIRRKRA